MTDPKYMAYEEGRRCALALQSRAGSLTGTQIIAQEEHVPDFDGTKNYSHWPLGAPVRCEGQVYTLLQPHHAAHYTGNPQGLPALWSVTHTTDPQRAKPWVESFGTSGLYEPGECCIWEGHVWRDLFPGNAYPPGTANTLDRWEDLGEVWLWQ